jgi:DNA-binding GntR family transcriptional regulator
LGRFHWGERALAFATPAASTHVRGLSKAVLVYDHLRAAIVGLTLEPGARIDKNEVCARLRVSR